MLSILTAIIGPIFAKEAIEISRRKRYYLNRVFYGAALLLVLFIVWENNRWMYQVGNISIAQMARAASELFLAVSIVQFVSVFVLVPLFLCGVLAGEREEHTLELLFTTQLRDRDIVLGKLFSRMAALLLLLLCGLPVISLVSLWGGIDPNALLRTLLATVLTLLFVGAHAIYFSAITRSPLGALVRTYWWLSLELLAIPFAIFLPVAWLTSGPRTTGGVIFLTGLLLTNPIALFATSVDGNLFNSMATTVGLWAYALAYLLPLIWSLILIVMAVRSVRGEPRPFYFPGLKWIRGVVQGLFHNPLQRGRRLAASEWAGLGQVRNPFWLRARRARVYDREGHIGRVQTGGWLLALGILVLMLVFGRREFRDQETPMIFLAFTWCGVALLGTTIAGGCLAGDRRRGFLELVLVTPVMAREVVDGTVLAVWEHLRRAFWLPFFLVGLFVVVGRPHLVPSLASLVIATLFLLVLVQQGVACSLTARTVTTALLASFVLPLTAFILPILAAVFFRSFHGLVLGIVCCLGLFLSWSVARARSGVVGTCLFFTFSYLTCAFLATAWTMLAQDREFPAVAMHPGVMVVALLGSRVEQEFARTSWSALAISYAAALVCHLVLARWWLIRNFDRLAGRAVVAEYSGARIKVTPKADPSGPSNALALPQASREGDLV